MFVAQFAATTVAFPQQTTQGQQARSASEVEPQTQSGGFDKVSASRSGPSADSSGIPPQEVSSSGLQDAPEPQQSAAQPLGTAVAPQEKIVGVAASRPAGAAIAPAKQKRARSLLISVGVVVAAAVAVGTVVALSKGSPSQPH